MNIPSYTSISTNTVENMNVHHTTVHVASSSDTPPSPTDEKGIIGSYVEPVHTNEKVPGHPGYYEKDGLRTYGDDEDHDHEPPVIDMIHDRKVTVD